jgi:oligoribonuclease NrnB/cAMP/cGMP phosphodiesterase (DHH superfamily)
MKKEQFSKLRKLNKDDKILLLTHTDMDGSTKIVMDQMFDNVDVWHCNNNAMSYLIKKAVTTEVADEYDAIVVTDISCNKEDAEIINNSPNKNKLTLLDHHPTATHLNQYPWAVVEVNVVEDSFRLEG